MSKIKNKLAHQLVRAGGNGPVAVNQHAAVFAHRSTKRNRSRGDNRRNAINDSKES